jgi:nucleoside-diphosphate-sugar epimerase
MKKVLIAGANSFVGRIFLKYSQYKNADEISLVENKPEDIDFGKYDVVLHLAAIVHQSKKIPDSEYYRVNKDLCLRVAENAKKAGVKQFVFLSTLKVYGEFVPFSEIRNESSKCFPDDAYGRSKFEAEIGLKELEDPDFIISIIRTPLVYGEGVKANMLSIVKLIDFLPVLPFGSVLNKRNFTYAENLIGYIDKIIEKRASGIFIAMDERAISTTELVIYLAKSLGKNVILFKLPQIFIKIGAFFKPGIFDRLYGSLEFENNKTRKELNFTPPYSIEEGIRKMVLSYRNKNQIF